MPSLPTIARAAHLGAPAGIRSMLPLAAVTRAGEAGLIDSPRTLALRLALTPSVARACAVMAAGEIVADKLPVLPRRTQALPLLGRGGLACIAALVAGARSAEAATAALAAVGTALVTYRVRRAVVSYGLPDPVAGAMEDVLALTLAMTAVAPRKSKVA